MAKRKKTAPAPEDIGRALQRNMHTLPDTEEVRQYINVHQGIVGLRAYLESIQPRDAHHEEVLKESIRQVEAYSNYIILIGEKLGKMAQELQPIYNDVEEMESLIMAELIKANPKLAGQTIDEFLDRYTIRELMDLSRDPDSFVSIALSAARAKAETATGTALPIVKYHPVEDDFLFLTDKLTREFFSQNARPGTIGKDVAAGQLSFDLFHERGNSIPLKYEPTGAEEITLYYNYGEMQNFDAKDYFIASALDALYFRGDTLVSLNKIWHEMGNDGSPSTGQLEDLEKRLIKGMTTPFIIDDKEVMQARGKDRYRQIVTNVIDAAYLSDRKVVNGKVTDGWIRINAPTMFSAVARDLNRIATWDRRVLSEYSGNRTSRYYTTLMFLLTQLSWMQHENSTRKNTLITYASLYKETGATTSRAKQLSRDMLYKVLDEVFVPLGFVTKYKEQGEADPGVLLTLATDNTIAARKPKQLKRKAAKK